jgi:hypothetical protein
MFFHSPFKPPSLPQHVEQSIEYRIVAGLSDFGAKVLR